MKNLSLFSLLFLTTSLAMAQTPSPQMSITESPLQKFKSVQSMNLASGQGLARLINLNTNVNSWYVLEFKYNNGKTEAFHLESTDSKLQLALKPTGKLAVNASGQVGECEVPRSSSTAKVTYQPICGGHLYLRRFVRGSQTWNEWIANGLRKNLGSVGETAVELIKEIKIPEPEAAKSGAQIKSGTLDTQDRPSPALLADPTAQIQPATHQLGIASSDPLAYGFWSRAQNHSGVYVSLLNPKMIAPNILNSYVWGSKGGRVKPLQEKESDAVVYLVALDTQEFQFGFALGTDFPELGWSTRPDRTKFAGGDLAGPDGFDQASPLVRIGSIPPHLINHVSATFVGGFKREHGAFKYGPLAEANKGSHYGFMENGVVMSSLNPNLATVAIDTQGQIDLLTWPKSDQEKYATLRHARQNGLPIIEGIGADGMSIPGSYVGDGRGSWSGDAQGNPVTIRSGICVQQTAHKKFLIYAYFSGATPNLMARVFQAYHCSYALLLDMNAYEHTFFALTKYDARSNNISREYLHNGMADAEPKPAHRFLNRPDNRDFFYVLRKQ